MFLKRKKKRPSLIPKLPRHGGPPLPNGLLLFMVALVLLISATMISNDKRFLVRLVADGHYEPAQLLMAVMSDDREDSDLEFAKIRLNRHALLKEKNEPFLDESQALDMAKRAWESFLFFDREERFLDEVSESLSLAKSGLSSCLPWLQTIRRSHPLDAPEYWLSFLLSVEKKSASLGNPEMAAIAMRERFRLKPPQDNELAVLLVLWRAANNSKIALESLSEHEKITGKDFVLGSVENAILKVTILGENSLLEACAEAIEKTLATHPQERLPLRDFAQRLEWAGKTHRAFDLYLVTSAKGDLLSMQRIIELNPGLYRDRELLEILVKAVPPEGDHPLRSGFAEILMRSGEYGMAEKNFIEHLKFHADDLKALLQLGQLQIEMNNLEAAYRTLHIACKQQPGDFGARTALAESAYLTGRFQESMLIYRDLMRDFKTVEEAQKCLILADSLGDYETQIECYKTMLIYEPEETPAHLMALSGIYYMLGEDDKQLETLNIAMRHSSSNPDIAFQVASILSDKKKYKEAIDVIAPHIAGTQKPEHIQMYLNLLLSIQDYQGACRFIKAHIPDPESAPPELRELVAYSYDGVQDFKASERIYASLYQMNPQHPQYLQAYAYALLANNKKKEVKKLLAPLIASDSSETLRLATLIASETNQLLLAERFQKRLLSRGENITAHDWRMLGDIYHARGSVESARQSWRYAIHRLKMELAIQ